MNGERVIAILEANRAPFDQEVRIDRHISTGGQ
jgi:hypothetical protein